MEAKQKIQVLIIDDHELIRIGMQKILETKSFIHAIFQAASINEGKNLFEKNNINVLITDMAIPEQENSKVIRKGGIFLIRELKQLKSDFSIIVITQYNDMETIKPLIDLEVESIITKSEDALFNINMAIEAIRKGGSYYSNDIAQLLKTLQTKPSAGLSGADLTPKEIEILKLMGEGLLNKEIAEILCRSEKTIEMHRRHIFTKLNVSNMVQAVNKARELGIIQ